MSNNLMIFIIILGNRLFYYEYKFSSKICFNDKGIICFDLVFQSTW